MTDKDTHSSTVAKALTILENFTSENPEWGIRELGRDLGINPTTVYRLVSTLQHAGYLEQNSETQRYTLGPRILKLAGIYTHFNPVSTVAQRVFEQYMARFDYSFYLGRLNQFEVIYLAVLDGRGPIKIVVEPGGSTSLHSTALGKVLLANQSDSYIEEFIQNTPLNAFTARTVTDPDQLRRQLHQVRHDGFAVNDGEHYDDIGAVGVPVPEQPKLGVSLAYPRHLVQQGYLRVDELVKLSQEMAWDIASRT